MTAEVELKPVTVFCDVRVPSADEHLTLSADLYLPTVAEPVPTLLNVLPYRNDMLALVENRWFATRGYACVQVNLMGTGASDGRVGGMWHAAEITDVLAAIDWIAMQDWSDGHVGLWGSSAGGFTALLGASRRPPAVKAVMAYVPASFDALHPGGFRADWHPRTSWGYYMLMEQMLPPVRDIHNRENRERWRRRLEEPPVALSLEPLAVGAVPMQEDRYEIDQIEAPTYCVSGWGDLWCDPTVALFEELTAPKKLLIGPWMHGQPHTAPEHAIDFLPHALRWWDHWLCGVDNGIMDEPPVTLHRRGSRPGWRSFNHWPVASDQMQYAACVDRSLVACPEGSEDRPAVVHAKKRALDLAYDPDPTIGALMGMIGTASNFGWPLDQHDDDVRSLCFTSGPIPCDVTLSGRAVVDLGLADAATGSDGTPNRVVARLSHVCPDDVSTLIAMGVCSQPRTNGPNHIQLGATYYGIPAGHRVRVALSDSQFPRAVPLRDPQGFRISGVRVLLPISEDSSGGVAHFDPLDRARPTDSEWRITRDHLNERLEVLLREASKGVMTEEGHSIDSTREVFAQVAKSEPLATATESRGRTQIRYASGETAAAAIRITCTQDELRTFAEVELDGAIVFSREWSRSLALP
jgi:putative CocE/NonD family hydrolase